MLLRPQFSPNELLTPLDLNRIGDYSLANLALLARYGMAPGTGVIRGLDVQAISPTPTMRCTVMAGCATGADGKLILLDADTSIGPLGANSSGLDRIDLVSIRYQEQPQSPGEARTFIGPSGNKFDNQVSTQTISSPVITITEGTPASVPVAPDTPQGDIALAQVRVANGATAVSPADIAQVEAQRNRLLRIGTQVDTSTAQPMPWASDPLIIMPVSTIALFIGTVTIALATLIPDVGGQILLDVVREDGLVGRCYVPIKASDAAVNVSAVVMGIVPAPATSRTYRLRVDVGGFPPTPTPQAFMRHTLLAGLVP